jgi:hypothetical protein
LALAAFDLMIGLWGGLIELYRAALHVALDAEQLGAQTLIWLLRSSALGTIALASGIFIALIWFILTSKAASIERAAVAHLLAE